MKRNLVFIGIVICGFALSFIGCGKDGPQGTQSTKSPQTGKVYMQTGSNLDFQYVGINRSVVDKNEVEFLLWVLMLKDDTREGGAWIIASYANGGKVQNAGWYDIAGVNKQQFEGPLLGHPHSCFLLRIGGIRIGNTYFEPNDSMGNLMKVVDGGTKDYFVIPPPNGSTVPDGVGPTLNLTAGDMSKFGPGEGYDSTDPNVSFDGVSAGWDYLKEFVIFVDEDKLYEIDYKDEIVLKDNWWESFSFSAK